MIGMSMQHIIIWDNDGTILGSKHPNDVERVLLPNVSQVMHGAVLNVICSGTKTSVTELQNWDPKKIIQQFSVLMETLPISLATFSPAIGGVECWIMIKHASGEIEIRKAHEDPRYQHLIGYFKKPGVGMFVVIQDLVAELYNQTIDRNTTVFVGDMLPDQQAAENFGIPFIEAHKIHTMHQDTALAALVGPITQQKVLH
jgi:hypothetical protein